MAHLSNQQDEPWKGLVKDMDSDTEPIDVQKKEWLSAAVKGIFSRHKGKQEKETNHSVVQPLLLLQPLLKEA